MEKPRALIFDVFGTIVDWRNGVANVAGKFLQEKSIDIEPNLFADKWRAEYQPAMERIRSGNRGYVSLDTLHLENLNIVLNDFGISEKFSSEEKMNLNKAWEQLPPWSDSCATLNQLKKDTIIAPCSNGSIALMTRLSKFAELPWDCILGAEVAQNYKPHPDAYLKSVAALNLKPSEVMMVAAHNGDLQAARSVGLQTAFVSRPFEYGQNQTTDLMATDNWDFQTDTFLDICGIFET